MQLLSTTLLSNVREVKKKKFVRVEVQKDVQNQTGVSCMYLILAKESFGRLKPSPCRTNWKKISSP